MPNLTIDGHEVSVSDGTTVIQAAEELGIFIPRYCYHPGLSIAGNCRICLVEVEKFPKLQIACNTPVSEGMIVHTLSDKAQEGRRAVLEFLLANHPLDCPVCDQSGECDLQNFYMNYGLYDPRFREQKVKKKKAIALGPHVMLDQERCILCSRCVRFTDEITKTGEFGIFNRGDRAELGLYPGDTLDNAYSGNVVDICPVGALTERDSRFKVRVWYLSSAPSVCNGCSQGCNIDVHFVLDRPHLNDGARIVRIKPRYHPDVNQWWMCDEGRFGFGWVDKQRLTKIRGPVDSRDVTWDQALQAIAGALMAASSPSQAGDSRIAVIASAQSTNEELFLIRKLFGDALGARMTADVPQAPGSSDELLRKADKNPNSTGGELLGFLGDGVVTAEQLIQDAAAGGVDVLWVFGHDLVDCFGEETVARLAEQTTLLVFSATNENAMTRFADWVLPTAAYLERDGTFVNCQGRVQRIGRVFPPREDAREDWRILLELARLCGTQLKWTSPADIFDAGLAKMPSFQGLSYQALATHGAMSPEAVNDEA